MRRSVVAWIHCAQESMNRMNLKCALSISAQNRDITQTETDYVFRLGLKMMK